MNKQLKKKWYCYICGNKLSTNYFLISLNEEFRDKLKIQVIEANRILKGELYE